ncbi:MAG: CPBP family intramembrane metalloprotease [Chloroflexi bacterium]|nr:CPBP family intramembrane metalloprotease [Chloroflexota bacterium]
MKQDNRAVWAFFLLAFGFSWIVGGLMIARRFGWIDIHPGIHYLMGVGPAAAALIVTVWRDDREGLADLGSRVLRFDRTWSFWALAFSPLLLAVVAAAIAILMTSEQVDLELLGTVDYLGAIGVPLSIGLWMMTFGFGEEIGWRGFAQHRLQQRFGPTGAALVIGVIWGLWHLPAFFYREGYLALGIGGFFGFLFSITAGSILLAWVYNRTDHSILAVAIWHALFDFTTVSPALPDLVAIVSSILVVVAAVLILALSKRTDRDKEQDVVPQFS